MLDCQERAGLFGGRGTPAPFDAPTEFVAVGPYRRVRNPMYIGGLTVLIGFALFAELFVVYSEEPTLRNKFRSRYQDYCRSVPAWIPKFFSGEWKLNVSRSDFGPLPAPTSRTDKIHHKDPSLKITTTQVIQQGERTREWSCPTDGKECTNTTGSSSLKSTVGWDGNALTINSKGTFNDNEVRFKDRRTLSEDDKTLTINRHLASPMGEADQTIVMKKQ